VFGRNACKRDPSLVKSKAFTEWVKRNSSLMMALA
jgi:hypothetical protein